MSSREVNQTEFAEMVGLTTRQIRNLEAEGLPSRAEKNGKYYPVPDAFRWVIKWKEDKARESGKNADYQRALTRKMTADARISELKAAELESALIPLAVHQEVLGRILDRVRARIRNLPGAWADQLVDVADPRRMVTLLRGMVDEISRELSTDAGNLVANVRHQEIPAQFPEVAVLRKAGVELFAELLDAEDLTAIPGIGPAKAQKIVAALEEFGLSREAEA